MKNILTTLLAAAACASLQAVAADANELSVHQTIRINAPPEAVWAVVGDFNGLPRWLAAIVDSKIVLGTNNRVGAIRQFTRRNGTKATERLLEYDPVAMRIAYTYVDGAVMASDYFPVMTVKDAGDGTSIVDWSARLKRLAYAVDPPPPGQDDKTLTELYNGIYKGALENLKRVVEAGR
jgi:Polyketide cyclase / dehydrase and lipid transport